MNKIPSNNITVTGINGFDNINGIQGPLSHLYGNGNIDLNSISGGLTSGKAQTQ
jgi:hypothetical protein